MRLHEPLRYREDNQPIRYRGGNREAAQCTLFMIIGVFNAKGLRIAVKSSCPHDPSTTVECIVMPANYRECTANPITANDDGIPRGKRNDLWALGS